MDEKEIKNLTNEELEKLLHEADYCDRDLLREYDERKLDGRIKFGPPIENLEEYFQKRREAREKKKAS